MNLTRTNRMLPTWNLGCWGLTAGPLKSLVRSAVLAAQRILCVCTVAFAFSGYSIRLLQLQVAQAIAEGMCIIAPGLERPLLRFAPAEKQRALHAQWAARCCAAPTTEQSAGSKY